MYNVGVQIHAADAMVTVIGNEQGDSIAGQRHALRPVEASASRYAAIAAVAR